MTSKWVRKGGLGGGSANRFADGGELPECDFMRRKKVEWMMVSVLAKCGEKGADDSANACERGQ